MQGFIEGVRTHNLKLVNLVSNTAFYRSYWTTYTPPPAPVMQPPRNGPSTLSGNSTHPDNTAAVARQLTQLRSTTDRLNTRLDGVNRDAQRAANGRRDSPPGYRRQNDPQHAHLRRDAPGTTSIKGKGRNGGERGSGGSGGGGVNRAALPRIGGRGYTNRDGGRDTRRRR